jgi:pimeloyl-ACP methyl ester carboxylesterase
MPIVLIPGLNCSARLYAEQIPALRRFGPVTVADHTRDDSIAAIAGRILAMAPPLFALAGLSMGGYIALEIMRAAPQRVAKLALLDTGARAETAELTRRRQGPMAMAGAGKLIEVADESFVFFVHPNLTATSHYATRCEPWQRRLACRRICASNRPSSRGRTRVRD